MRPLKARGKEWVQGLNSGGGGGSTSIVSRLGGSRSGSIGGGAGVEDVDSDGSDLVRRIEWFVG